MLTENVPEKNVNVGKNTGKTDRKTVKRPELISSLFAIAKQNRWASSVV